ncbi:MAG: FeoA family protein [Campylobacterota bacterium]
MTLDKLEKNDCAIIKKIDCDEILKNRFYSFGIVKNSKVKVEELTLRRSTIEIKIDSTKVALRLNEASAIEVEKCN